MLQELRQEPKLAIVSRFDESKGYGFARTLDGKKLFFHQKKYRLVNPNKENPEEPLLVRVLPPHYPARDSRILVWLDPGEVVREGASPSATDWTYVQVWNRGRLPHLSNEEPEPEPAPEKFMTEEELLRGLEGLGDPALADDSAQPVAQDSGTSGRVAGEVDVEKVFGKMRRIAIS